ncbi:uncharacterized protein LOC103314105 [Tribolium castaneum]|uniref:Uncharacterized protein n=1 Tax=Tribolium castaneum TaxID=7070 RepID=D6WY40_TRICA|nr:PREDICTED: uncharacterized protein LOC103314105 [Tribolium castaneum]EFA07898.2 hypothetical protein TcasGA2_TC005473 [Tribolium castaneum]|eukprot:XP_008197315.1 PREDICTED: uncharacterized protein LOC103314105 [Tribolium castaneum]
MTASTTTVETSSNFSRKFLEPTPALNQTQKSIKELFYNGTGYYIEDEVDTGLNDLQTLFLACFATLIPLVISLLTAFGIRVLWTKYKRQKENSKYDGMAKRDASDDNAKPLHSHLLNSDKKCETHLAITTEEVEVCDDTGVSQIRSNNHSSTNGSIITMTLKNNHLIVETEERNDIEEDSRETTMKYSPGARDGVFVVEVQQGVRRSPGSGPQSGADPELSVSVSDQCALVHNPPDRYSDDETLEECDDYYIETASPARATPDSLVAQIRTGLAQSDPTLNEEHPSYSYSTQQCYDSGFYGYHIYNGYINDEPLQRLKAASTKPKITAAVYKNRAEDDVHIFANDISYTTEPDVGSGEYENKGFD